MRKEFTATMNFSTVSDTMIQYFNQYLTAQVEISAIEAEYAPMIAEANEAVKSAQAELDALTPVKDTDPHAWANARDNVTLAVNKAEAINKIKTNALKAPRKVARETGKAIAPVKVYEAYKQAVEFGQTEIYVKAVSDWLLSMGFTRRSKDKNGKLWSLAVSDIMIASGVKSRDMELKARPELAWRKDIITMILTRGLIQSNAWDLDENNQIVKRVF